MLINIQKTLRQNLAGKLLNHFIVFLINVLIVRMLGTDQSGAYFNELYILNFIAFIFSMGMDFSVVRLLSQEPALAGPLKKMMSLVVLFFIAIASGFIFFTGEGSLLSLQPRIAMFIFCTGNLLLILFQGWLSAVKKFNTQNIILLSSNFIFLIWLFINKNIDGPAALFSISYGYGSLFIIQGLLMYLFSIPSSTSLQKKVKISWFTFLKGGMIIMLSSLAYFGFLRVDNFFVEKYTNPQTLSNYVQCGKVGQYFIYFSSIISSTMLPFMRIEGFANSFKEWVKMLRPYVSLLIVASLIILIFGAKLFPLVFGDGFQEMFFYMAILLPGYVCLGMLTLINTVYIGKGKLVRMLYGDIGGFLLVTILDFFFVPKYGAVGAAIISSVAYCLLFIYLLLGLRKLFLEKGYDETLHYE